LALLSCSHGCTLRSQSFRRLRAPRQRARRSPVPVIFRECAERRLLSETLRRHGLLSFARSRCSGLSPSVAARSHQAWQVDVKIFCYPRRSAQAVSLSQQHARRAAAVRRRSTSQAANNREDNNTMSNSLPPPRKDSPLPIKGGIDPAPVQPPIKHEVPRQIQVGKGPCINDPSRTSK
jgi:hypothetical protein